MKPFSYTHHRYTELQRNRLHQFLTLGIILLFTLLSYQCSTEKTGWAHRTYHNTTSYYNGYFNARELVKTSVASFEESYEEDYTQILPVFKYTDEQSAQGMLADMDLAIEKCSKVINRHSIEKRNEEHVKWIDECYYVIGQANFYKLDYPKARQFFEYVSKKYKSQETRYDAMLWLAKTLIQQENYEKAERILRLAEGDEAFPERLYPEIRKIYTDLYLRQDNIPLAIPELQIAIELTKKKKQRVRLTYLLGQLYAEQGERKDASDAFKRVIAMHPDYKMLFYAKIQRALAQNTDFGGREEVRKELRKMLADEKYLEFRDQIYYGLAMMDKNEGNIPGTLENLQNSVDASVGNSQQKGRSFLAMGEIHFEQKNYQKAQAYYDSTVSFLDPNYPNYDEVVLIADNLDDLVAQIVIIEEQDSLLRVANMSDNEREKLIAGLIQEKLEEEERRKAEFEAAQFADNSDDSFGGGLPPTPGGVGGPPGGSNKWYFYNPATVGFGAAEFKRIWGTRKNADNWRRSNKTQLDPLELLAENEADTAAGSSFIVNADGDTIEVSNDWEDPSYWLKGLPFSEEDQTTAKNQIIEAYHELAIIYKEQMEDTPASIETLLEMDKRFAPHKYQADSYYRLYRAYMDLSEINKADTYKNKILQEYPESDFAKILIDPDYFAKNNESEKAATAYYDKTYDYYIKGYYYQTILNCDYAFEHFPESSLFPQFKLLRALATGQENGKEQLLVDLQAIAAEYKDQEVGQKASQLITVLTAEPEAEKTVEEEVEEEPSPYTFDPNSKHNFVVLLPEGQGNLLIHKNNISDFNLKNYKMDGLKSRNLILQEGMHMVAIMSFPNAESGLVYLTNFSNNQDLLKDINGNEFPRFIISYNNYAVFYKRKNVEEYMEFFNQHYTNP